MILLHTDLDEELAAEGQGDVLVREALEELRRTGAKARVVCPVVAAYVARHRELGELVVHTGAPSRGLPG